MSQKTAAGWFLHSNFSPLTTLQTKCILCRGLCANANGSVLLRFYQNVLHKASFLVPPECMFAYTFLLGWGAERFLRTTRASVCCCVGQNSGASNSGGYREWEKHEITSKIKK